MKQRKDVQKRRILSEFSALVFFFLKSKKLKYLLQIGEICEEIVPYTNVLPQKS